MFEVEINPENGYRHCYTKLPFVPPLHSSLSVIEDGRQRNFTITTVSTTAVYEPASETWDVSLYLGALEMIRE